MIVVNRLVVYERGWHDVASHDEDGNDHDDCHVEMKSDNQFDHDFQDEGGVYFCKLQKCAIVMADGQKWTYLFSYNPIV
jgi:hypothetical protein